MKVRNLYIGEILMIKKIDYECDYAFLSVKKHYSSRILRQTILYESNYKKNTVKDIIFGGTYKIECPNYGKVGDKFASELRPIITFLNSVNYDKKSISKRKLLKLIKTKHQTINNKEKEEEGNL